MDNIFNGYKINSCRDIERLRNDVYKRYPYVHEIPLRKDHVIDEDMSVKWNREAVELHNKEIIARRKERNGKIYAELHQIEIATVKWIKSELSDKVSEEQAQRLYNKLYSQFEQTLFEGKLDSLLEAIGELFI